MAENKKCIYCEGIGRWECDACSGKGSRIVPNLNYIPLYGGTIDEIQVCKLCNGTGKITCRHCKGKGYQR